MKNLEIGSVVLDKNNETAEVAKIHIELQDGGKSLVILTFLNHSTFTSFQANLETVEAYFNTGMWELK